MRFCYSARLTVICADWLLRRIVGRQHDVSECMDNCVFQIETALLKFDGLDESEDGKSSVVKRYVAFSVWIRNLRRSISNYCQTDCSMGPCGNGWSALRLKAHGRCQPTKAKTSFPYFPLACPMKDMIYTTASAVIFIQRRSSIRTPSRWRLLSSTFPLCYKFNFRYVAPAVIII